MAASCVRIAEPCVRRDAWRIRGGAVVCRPCVKILVIRFSSIGDIVLTSPVVRCIHGQVPGAEVHFLTKEEYRPLVQYNPHIARVHALGADLPSTIAALKKEGFGYVADLHRNLRSRRVKDALGVAKTHAFPKLNARKWVLANLRLNWMPPTSVVERYFEAVRPLGVRPDGKGLDFFIPESARTAQDDLPMGHWPGFVACVIGGSYATKQAPAHKWQELFSAMPFPVVLLGGPEDRTLGLEISNGYEGRVYNACGKFNFLESADLIARARVVVSNDTGLMHVAAALGKPVVSLWGATAPEFGMFPWYGFNDLERRPAPQGVMLERRGLRCHPCSKLGQGRCPRGHFKCMRELDMGAGGAAVKTLWASTQR